VNHFLTTPF